MQVIYYSTKMLVSYSTVEFFSSNRKRKHFSVFLMRSPLDQVKKHEWAQLMRLENKCVFLCSSFPNLSRVLYDRQRLRVIGYNFHLESKARKRKHNYRK